LSHGLKLLGSHDALIAVATLAAPPRVGAVVRLTPAVLNVERDVTKSYVWFAAVAASAGVLVFSVFGKDLRIPAIDREQVLPADLQPFGMTAYHTLRLDHEGAALMLPTHSLAHTAKALTA
jgi:hypothetical protein